MRGKRSAILLRLLAVFIATEACHDVELGEGAGSSCKSTKDCRRPYVCRASSCQDACGSQQDCEQDGCTLTCAGAAGATSRDDENGGAGDDNSAAGAMSVEAPDGATAAGGVTAGRSGAGNGGAASAEQGGVGDTGGSGFCAPAAMSGAPVCDDPHLVCGTECVNPRSSLEHCGATASCKGSDAGEKCNGSDRCLAGTCRPWPSWQAAVRVSAEDAPMVAEPSLAVAPDGTATVAWLQSSTGGFELDEVWVNRSAPGTGFESAERIESGLVVEDTPLLLADADGSVTLILRSESGLWAKRLEAGIGWQAPELISFDGAVGSPQVSLDRAGAPVVIWSQTVEGSPALWLTRYDATTGWTDALRVDEGNGSPVAYGIAADSDGSMLIGWSESEGGQKSLRTRRYDGANAFHPAVTVKEGESAKIWAVVPAFNNYGEGILVWWVGGDETESVWGSAYERDCGWGASIELATANVAAHQHMYFPVAQFGDSGTALIVWNQTTAGDSALDVWSASYSAATGWRSGSRLTATVRNALEPRVAMDGDGNALIYWMQQDTSNWEIFRIWSLRTTAMGESEQPVQMNDPGETKVWLPSAAFASDGAAMLIWYGTGVWARELQ
jgi:hypothetical protein